MKKRFWWIAGAALGILCVLSVIAFALVLRQSRVFPTTTLYVNNAPYTVEVASTSAQRAQGLQGREQLETQQGMLFVFPTADRHIFWMKNTLIPLDLVWVSQGQVIQVTMNVQPEPGVSESELTLYQPDLPVDMVLEIPAGDAERYGIEPGVRLTSPE